MAHQAGAYPGFCSMKRLGVFLLPSGWDASPSQGYPPALSSPVPNYTPGWREAPWELSVLPKNTTQCPRPGLEPRPLAPESSALTMRPPRLPPCCEAIFSFVPMVASEQAHLFELRLPACSQAIPMAARPMIRGSDVTAKKLAKTFLAVACSSEIWRCDRL